MTDFAERFGLAGRLLDERELTQLVRRIAADEDLWRPLVNHVDGERNCVSLYADEEVGVWVISWMPGQDTGLHDHAGSHGAVTVVEGEVVEGRPDWAHEGRWQTLCASESFTFEVADVHRVVALDEAAVTIHAYSPPLHAMGVYRPDEGGQMRRTTVRWDQLLTA